MNKGFPIYPELKGILLKTVGLANVLKEGLAKAGPVEVAFIYGSVAKNLENAASDIDLMVIGDPDLDALTDAVLAAEETLSREVNYTVFSGQEWEERAAVKDSFVVDVLKHKRVFLVGDEDELRRIG